MTVPHSEPEPQRDETVKESGRATIILSMFFLLLFCVRIGFSTEDPEHSSPKVTVIPVSGEVSPSMENFLRRAMQARADDPEAIFVFEMDTFGGRVDSALKIVDDILTIPKGRTIAYVKTKAISAGALIALSCQDLYMRPSTTIGDCAPISITSDGPVEMGEKFQSPLRAKFRTLARRNNYPPELAQAMVTADLEIIRVELADQVRYLSSEEFDNLDPEKKKEIISSKTVVAKGELLTMDDAEALKFNFSRGTVSSLTALLDELGYSDYPLERMEPNWSESLVTLIAMISPILMLIGMAGLYIEMKTPGLGAPGLLGILCLGLVFFSQYLVGLADYTELLLLLTGVILLAVEVFVLPGFGIAGITGFICIGLGMILSFQDFVLPDPTQPWQADIMMDNFLKISFSLVTAFLAGLTAIRYVLPQINRVVDGPYLNETLADSRDESRELAGIRAGATGRAVTALRPSGKIDIEGELVQAVTEGEFVESDTPVRILRIDGNRIIVSQNIESDPAADRE